MFLSATASNSAVKLVSWSPSGQKKPKLFLHSNPLPHNHFYRVESRSMTWTDVAARIAKILSDYAREHPEGPQAKALCFFVGRAIVGTFSDLLNEKKITSLAYVGAETEKQKQRNNTILREFKETDVQVLCANLALGRGVDDLPKNIRFCFHVQMPESLRKCVHKRRFLSGIIEVLMFWQLNICNRQAEQAVTVERLSATCSTVPLTEVALRIFWVVGEKN